MTAENVDTRKRPATEAESAELSRLVAAIYAGDSDADRAEALAAALADPDAALLCYRAIAAERGISTAAPWTPPWTPQGKPEHAGEKRDRGRARRGAEAADG